MYKIVGWSRVRVNHKLLRELGLLWVQVSFSVSEFKNKKRVGLSVSESESDS